MLSERCTYPPSSDHADVCSEWTHTPVSPSLWGWAGRRPGRPPPRLCPAPPGTPVSSWPAPPSASERTDWPPVGPASPGPRSEPSPAPAARPAHTSGRGREGSQRHWRAALWNSYKWIPRLRLKPYWGGSPPGPTSAQRGWSAGARASVSLGWTPPAGRLWDDPGAAPRSGTAHRSAGGPGCSTCSEAAWRAPDRTEAGAHSHSGTEAANRQTDRQMNAHWQGAAYRRTLNWQVVSGLKV